MIERFNGPDGNANLRSVLLQQRIVEHDEAIVDALIVVGTLTEFQTGDAIIEQAGSDNWVFFILAGAADVNVNARHIGTRNAGEVIGEMSAIDPSAPRSATVRAKSETVALRISAADFLKIANDFPKMWQATARIIGERLRQRQQFHRPPNSKPILFIGSSVEGLPIAKHIQLGLKHETVEATVWTNDVFGPSGIPIDELLAQVDRSDFAAFVFGPDDQVASRAELYQAPRDNIILEMGLFLAGIGRARTYMVKEQKTDLKIPSDLIGMTPITYVADTNSKLEVVLGPVCTEIAKKIRELGAR